jgi:hypothetical protein
LGFFVYFFVAAKPDANLCGLFNATRFELRGVGFYCDLASEVGFSTSSSPPNQTPIFGANASRLGEAGKVFPCPEFVVYILV